VGGLFGGSSSAGLAAFSDAALSSVGADQLAADALTESWLASYGGDALATDAIGSAGGGEALLAFDPSGGYLTAAAAVLALNGDASVSDQVTSSVNGLGDSVANIFGW
jgi:hypothetical protein